MILILYENKLNLTVHNGYSLVGNAEWRAFFQQSNNKKKELLFKMEIYQYIYKYSWENAY